MLGGLIWTNHAIERLDQRFGIGPAEVVEAASDEVLRLAAQRAREVRIGALNLCLKLTGGEENIVQTAVWIKPPSTRKTRRPARWRFDDDE